MSARVTIEIEWTPSAADLAKVYAGDAPVDFAWRSFERRLRQHLDTMCVWVGDGMHYHIVDAPELEPEEGQGLPDLPEPPTAAEIRDDIGDRRYHEWRDRERK